MRLTNIGTHTVFFHDGELIIREIADPQTAVHLDVTTANYLRETLNENGPFEAPKPRLGPGKLVAAKGNYYQSSSDKTNIEDGDLGIIVNLDNVYYGYNVWNVKWLSGPSEGKEYTFAQGNLTLYADTKK